MTDENKKYSDSEIKAIISESNKNRRKLEKLERSFAQLSLMYENSEHLRSFNEKELSLQFLYNRLLLETSPILIFILDRELNYVTGSRQLMQILSFADQREMAKLSFGQLFSRITSAQWIKRMVEQCCESLSESKHIHFNDTMEMNSGETLQFEVYISPAIDTLGFCLGVAVVLHDVTDLTNAVKNAKAADRAKATFLANMSHEIRTPMNAIKGMSDLLLLTRLDDAQKGYARSITSASQSLLAIINDLLDFSKIEANKLDLVEVEAHLGQLLADVAGLINLKASEKGIDFIVRMDPGAPETILCDDIRLKQVLLNLLNNAVKFTHKGNIGLTLKSGPAREERGVSFVPLTFGISDSGIGIKDEELDVIFQPFAQSDKYANRGIEGTGLGLPISGKLVRKMGGELKVRSEYGRGSEFFFTIEVEVVSAAPLASVSFPESKRVLLVVGDAHRFEYENILNDLGIVFDTCADEEKFSELLKRNEYTHLIYEYAAGNTMLNARMDVLPVSCQIVALKDIRFADLQNTPSRVEALFEPILATAIARVLDNLKTSERSIRENTGSDAIGAFKCPEANILLVDDNDINLLVESELLRQYDIEPDLANSARDAYKMVEDKRYDIIFMDHMMPDINGVEATKTLRGTPGWTEEVPIIALTANAITGMKETYLSCGMSDFISKPIEIQDLNRILLQWLPNDKISAQETQNTPKNDS
jgi:signal transduction histidine kinase/CheY-like chemotaxis protein